MCPETYHLWVIKGPKKQRLFKSDAINRLSISVLHIRNSKDPTLQYGGPLQRGTTMTTEGQEDEIYFRS
jgi:hypothetical protein